MHIALTIAGSDSGGGAGIQADLKTFYRFGVFGTSVVTAVTAQNTHGVRGWAPMTPDLVSQQLDAVAEDLRPAAVKSGMLGEAEVVRAVAEGLRRHQLAPYILDPVMVATSGDPLLTQEAIEAIRRELLPLADLVTPNLDETEILLGGEPLVDEDGMVVAAKRLVDDLGAKAALVKGGHLLGPQMVDVLYLHGAIHQFRHERIDTTSTHGTGCTLSAAITAAMASGVQMLPAVMSALDYVNGAIRTAPNLGGGHGPLNHFA